MRFHPCRGSMDLGERTAGFRRTTIVQDVDTILAHTEEMIGRFHDPSPGSMLRIAVAPCSPFSASEQLMRGSAELARRLGVRLHTHIAETRDEETFCRERFGMPAARAAGPPGLARARRVARARRCTSARTTCDGWPQPAAGVA